MSREAIYYWKCDRPSAFQPRPEPNAEELRELLQAAVQETITDPGARLEPFSSQGNHLAWLVHHADESRTSFLRVENGPEMDDYMEVESHLLDCVRSRSTPTPRVIACDTTRETVACAWQLIEYLPHPTLRHWHKLGNLDLQTIPRQIGRAIADFQRVPVEGFGPFQPDQLRESGKLVGYHRTYPDYFFLRLGDHLSALQSGSFLSRTECERIEALLRDHASLLELERPCLVHKDTALWNILGTQDRITAVIDWDDAIGGDPVDDLALLGCFFDQPILEAATAGYETRRPRPDNFAPRLWLHVLRNLLFKAVIRLRGGYFDHDDQSFLINAGGDGAGLRADTRKRLLNAMENLEKASSFPSQR